MRKREAIQLNDCGDRGVEFITADTCVGRGEEKKDLTVEEIRDARLKRFAGER